MSSVTRGVTLVRQGQQRVFVSGRGEGFRLRIEAHLSNDMPTELFLHQKSLIDPQTGEQMDEFISVCSCFDLTIYPANTPDLTQFPQFYRRDHIDVVLASQEMASDAWLAIYAEVCGLVDALNKLDWLEPGEAVRCGADSTPDESISESIIVDETQGD